MTTHPPVARHSQELPSVASPDAPPHYDPAAAVFLCQHREQGLHQLDGLVVGVLRPAARCAGTPPVRTISFSLSTLSRPTPSPRTQSQSSALCRGSVRASTRPMITSIACSMHGTWVAPPAARCGGARHASHALAHTWVLGVCARQAVQPRYSAQDPSCIFCPSAC